MLDRFDLRVPVHRPEVDELLIGSPGEGSAAVAVRVEAARTLAFARGGCLNGAIPAPMLDGLAPLDTAAKKLLRIELERDRLTGRGYHRVRRVARTIADLDPLAGDVVNEGHVALALQFRVRLSPLLRGRAA